MSKSIISNNQSTATVSKNKYNIGGCYSMNSNGSNLKSNLSRFTNNEILKKEGGGYGYQKREKLAQMSIQQQQKVVDEFQEADKKHRQIMVDARARRKKKEEEQKEQENKLHQKQQINLKERSESKKIAYLRYLRGKSDGVYQELAQKQQNLIDTKENINNGTKGLNENKSANNNHCAEYLKQRKLQIAQDQNNVCMLQTNQNLPMLKTQQAQKQFQKIKQHTNAIVNSNQKQNSNEKNQRKPATWKELQIQQEDRKIEQFLIKKDKQQVKNLQALDLDLTSSQQQIGQFLKMKRDCHIYDNQQQEDDFKVGQSQLLDSLNLDDFALPPNKKKQQQQQQILVDQKDSKFKRGKPQQIEQLDDIVIKSSNQQQNTKAVEELIGFEDSLILTDINKHSNQQQQAKNMLEVQNKQIQLNDDQQQHQPSQVNKMLHKIQYDNIQQPLAPYDIAQNRINIQKLNKQQEAISALNNDMNYNQNQIPKSKFKKKIQTQIQNGKNANFNQTNLNHPNQKSPTSIGTRDMNQFNQKFLPSNFDDFLQADMLFINQQEEALQNELLDIDQKCIKQIKQEQHISGCKQAPQQSNTIYNQTPSTNSTNNKFRISKQQFPEINKSKLSQNQNQNNLIEKSQIQIINRMPPLKPMSQQQKIISSQMQVKSAQGGSRMPRKQWDIPSQQQPQPNQFDQQSVVSAIVSHQSIKSSQTKHSSSSQRVPINAEQKQIRTKSSKNRCRDSESDLKNQNQIMIGNQCHMIAEQVKEESVQDSIQRLDKIIKQHKINNQLPVTLKLQQNTPLQQVKTKESEINIKKDQQQYQQESGLQPPMFVQLQILPIQADQLQNQPCNNVQFGYIDPITNQIVLLPQGTVQPQSRTVQPQSITNNAVNQQTIQNQDNSQNKAKIAEQQQQDFPNEKYQKIKPANNNENLSHLANNSSVSSLSLQNNKNGVDGGYQNIKRQRENALNQKNNRKQDIIESNTNCNSSESKSINACHVPNEDGMIKQQFDQKKIAKLLIEDSIIYEDQDSLN